MPGLTLRSLLRQRERSQCDVSRHLWFPANVYEMTLASRPASPGTNVPSRNQSAPLELYDCTVYGGTAADSQPFPGHPARVRSARRVHTRLHTAVWEGHMFYVLIFAGIAILLVVA